MATNNQFRRVRKRVPVVNLGDRDYNGLVLLADRIESFMTGNASFPTPNPTLIAVAAARDAVMGLIPTPGRRNSYASNQALYVACGDLKTAINLLMAYVWNLVGDDGDYINLYLSSGLSFANKYSRTSKTLQKVKKMQQYNTTANPHTLHILKWAKSRGLIKGAKPTGYKIYKIIFQTGARVGLMTTTTRTSYQFTGGQAASGEWFEIVPFNTNGEGVPFRMRLL